MLADNQYQGARFSANYSEFIAKLVAFIAVMFSIKINNTKHNADFNTNTIIPVS
ncbi:hypothetical protein [Pleurocapsa sp. PCC 7319]|uniref:hypothetical protein n=1 Tax=Pleurocapsa sp. PCC 7319 TaxID=118161 RepID=UPI000349E124|nr:hypothetical protein [Pleurocapsa sp. PCC 7319]